MRTTFKNGKRTIKLDSSERRTLEKAKELCEELGKIADDVQLQANCAAGDLDVLLAEFPADKPKPGQAPSEQAKAQEQP